MRIMAVFWILFGLAAVGFGAWGLANWMSCNPGPMGCGFHLVFTCTQWALGVIGVGAGVAFWRLGGHS